MEEQDFKNRIDLDKLNEAAEKIRTEIGKVIVGQTDMIEQLIIAILTDGHILIEGVPGVAKTLTAKLFAKSISADFSRLQFTPDLMPSDVVGTTIYNSKAGEFEFKAGPIFANLVLIDEINRAPAKTQAALFEVMEERQVTVDGTTYKLDAPFIVFATQNPIEQEGTYRLPEAQLDRFLFKINVNYPSVEDEAEILNRAHNRKSGAELDDITAYLTKADIEDFRQKIKALYIDENLRKYIAQIIHKTRNNNALYLGASPRASVNIMNASKAAAALAGRDFVVPDDIKMVSYPVLRHRLILSPEKEMEGVTPDAVIKQIINSVEIPR